MNKDLIYPDSCFYCGMSKEFRPDLFSKKATVEVVEKDSTGKVVETVCSFICDRCYDH